MARKSKQRDCILENLQSRTDHPTAEMLYFSLKEDMPNLSLGTVYRNLSRLSEQGEILKLDVNGVFHYDGCIRSHYHLSCMECGQVFDVEPDPLPVLETVSIANARILYHELMFHGICPNCNENHHNNHGG